MNSVLSPQWSRFAASHVKANRRKRPLIKSGRRGIWLEALEARLMFSVAPPLVVGRTQSSYFAGDVPNRQETLTFTVYNNQADPITSVSLRDVLQPGVTFLNASIVPDQSGAKSFLELGHH